jgi:hypothetical protein
VAAWHAANVMTILGRRRYTAARLLGRDPLDFERLERQRGLVAALPELAADADVVLPPDALRQIIAGKPIEEFVAEAKWKALVENAARKGLLRPEG